MGDTLAGTTECGSRVGFNPRYICKDAFGEKSKYLVKEIPFQNIPAHVNQEVGQRVEITVS